MSSLHKESLNNKITTYNLNRSLRILIEVVELPNMFISFKYILGKTVRPEKVDILYKYKENRLKVVLDTEIFCYRQQRNNS